MVIFDANMILRYLLNDNDEMAEKAERYLQTEEVSVTIEVIAEVVYVLNGVYSMEREKISDTIQDFLRLVNCRDLDALTVGLKTYKEHNLDFVDCILYGYTYAEYLQENARVKSGRSFFDFAPAAGIAIACACGCISQACTRNRSGCGGCVAAEVEFGENAS